MKKLLMFAILLATLQVSVSQAEASSGVDLEYVVTIEKSGDVAHVRLSVSQPPRREMKLHFEDYDGRSINIKHRVRDITFRDESDTTLEARYVDRRWYVRPEVSKLLIIDYDIDKMVEIPGPTPAEPVRYMVRIDENGGYAWVRYFFLVPHDEEIASIRVSFNLPAEWSVITPFESDGNYFVPSGELQPLKLEFLRNNVFFGKIELYKSIDCGGLNLSFVVFDHLGKYRWWWKEEYGTTKEKEAEIYLDFACKTFDKLKTVFGGLTTRGFNLFDMRGSNAVGFVGCSQLWHRERRDDVPHHIMHAWIGWDSPMWFRGKYGFWFLEGIPVYYGHVITSDLLNNNMFRGKLYENYLIYRIAEKKGRLDDWQIDHYAYGEMRTYELDRKIREVTNGSKSLDDILSYTFQEYGRKNAVFGDEEMLSALQIATGQDLSDFYNEYIAGNASLPLSDIGEFEKDFEEYVRYFSDKYFLGSRTMYFVYLNLVTLNSPSIDYYTQLHGVDYAMIDKFTIYIRSHYNISNLTEDDVIETMEALTGRDCSDFFEFFTINGERPSLEELKMYLQPPTEAPTITPPPTTTPAAAEEPNGILQKIIAFLKRLFGLEKPQEEIEEQATPTPTPMPTETSIVTETPKYIDEGIFEAEDMEISAENSKYNLGGEFANLFRTVTSQFFRE
jgi:hypothetical protein